MFILIRNIEKLKATSKWGRTPQDREKPASADLPPLMRKLNTRPAPTWNGYLISHNQVRLTCRLTDSLEYYLDSASTKSRRTSFTRKKSADVEPACGVPICVCGFGGRSTPGARAGPLPAPFSM